MLNRFTILLLLCTLSGALVNSVHAGECNYEWTKSALRSACTGIAKELQEIKEQDTINVVVTAVGTGAAGGALYAGIKRSDINKKIAELDKQMADIKNMSNADFVRFLKNLAALEEAKTQLNSICSQKRQLQAQAKKLGNWRTGLMVGNTATAVAGTIISGKNEQDSGDIKEMIQNCLDTINKQKQNIGQAQIDCSPTVSQTLQTVINECGKMSTAHMDKVSKNSNTSKIVSAVNIGTGLAGTVTSAVANSKNTPNPKADKAANIFAGTSAVASGTSTVFNAITLKAINDNLKSATACEEAIYKL
ncbi:MAG: hypothetical protein J5613_03635 [Alphaproteobacteria bacterium]|nr:hypothetical protein [Alphaproteobacteria bacterium]MBR4806743.1 hypothetical protein [Alphaproteobacteria bacterium]